MKQSKIYKEKKLSERHEDIKKGTKRRKQRMKANNYISWSYY